jgi:hypothetical protein
MNKGTNDAIGVSFFFVRSFYILLILSVLFKLDLSNEGTRRAGGDDANGPKRRIWRRLGHRCVFFIFVRSFKFTTVFNDHNSNGNGDTPTLNSG